MISVDKVIAITFPLRYRKIMKPRVVSSIIITKWVLAIVLFIHNLFNSRTLLGTLITYIIPVFFACSLSAVLNIYLTIKAYNIHKQIQEENKLSGGHSRDNNQLKVLQKKQSTIKKHRKPLITLLVVVLGSSSVGMLFPLLFIPTAYIESPEFYEAVVLYVIIPNVGYFSLLFHPLVYGLYFKQIREPMMRLLKIITYSCKCKSVKVVPQPQRNRITWFNLN